MLLKKSPEGPSVNSKTSNRRLGERSFSLVETVVAVSLIAFLMVEMSGVHGNAINFADYGRKSLQATYLAKRLMAQVEYQAQIRSPLKDIAVNDKEHAFEDAPDFQYSLSIEPLPHSLDIMFKILSGGLLDGDEKKNEQGEAQSVSGMLEQLKGPIQTAVGEDPIWIAKTSVSWAEGARRSSVDLAMIITDIKRLNPH